MRNWIYWAATVPSGHVRRSWWLTCTIVIAIASLMPNRSLSGVRFLGAHGDTCIHFVMYATYALAFCWAWPQRIGRRRAALAGVSIVCALYGLLMEILQGSLGALQREFSATDAAANALGAVAGSWMWFRAAAGAGSRAAIGS